MSPQVPVLQVYIISAASACYCTHAYCMSVCLQMLPPVNEWNLFFLVSEWMKSRFCFSINSSLAFNPDPVDFSQLTPTTHAWESPIFLKEKKTVPSNSVNSWFEVFFLKNGLKLTGNSILLGTNYHAVECWPGVITLFETVRSGINCKAKHFVAALLRKLDPKLAVCFCSSCKWPASIFVSSTTCEEK